MVGPREVDDPQHIFGNRFGERNEGIRLNSFGITSDMTIAFAYATAVSVLCSTSFSSEASDALT